MKFERDSPGGRNTFSGYGEGYVQVGAKRHAASLVVSGERVIEDWPAASVDALSADHFAAIIELAPEIVLLGTGASFRFPEPALLAPLYKAGHRRRSHGHARRLQDLQHPAGRGT